MYTILVDGANVMGDETETAVIDPVVTVGLNKAGTAEFTLPPTHPFYEQVEEMKSIVEIHEIDDEGIDDIIFFGRVSGTNRDWFNRKRVTCEGALAFFNDTIQRRKVYQTKNTTVESFFRDLITRHNSNYPPVDIDEPDPYANFRFQVPNDDGVDIRDPQDPDVEKKNNEKKIYRMTDYQKTIECLQEMCVDAEGGYLFVERDGENERNNIYWWSKMKYDDLNQNVQFGLNLLDINQDFASDELYTALLPLGASYDYYKRITSPGNVNPSEKGWYHKDENGGYYATSDESVDPTHIYYQKEERRKNIKSVNNDADYLQDDDAVERYGFILQVKEWSDISSPKKLKKKALEWLTSERFDKLNITCNATDLSVVNPDYDKIKIGARVRVVSPKHGITEKIFPISEIVYHLDSGKKEITLGTQERKTLSYITSKGTKEYRMPDAYYDEDADPDDEEEEEE